MEMGKDYFTLRYSDFRFLFDRSQLDLGDWDACLDELYAALDLLPECASLHYSCAIVFT